MRQHLHLANNMIYKIFKLKPNFQNFENVHEVWMAVKKFRMTFAKCEQIDFHSCMSHKINKLGQNKLLKINCL